MDIVYDSSSWTGATYDKSPDNETLMWLEALEDSLCQVSPWLWRLFPCRWKLIIAGNLYGWHWSFNESSSYGYREANIACQEMAKAELIKEERERIFEYIRGLTLEVDDGPASAFTVMNHGQRIAMHKLFNAEQFYKKECRK